VSVINDSLADVEYNRGRFIRLEPQPAPDTVVRDFRADLRACTEDVVSGDASDIAGHRPARRPARAHRGQACRRDPRHLGRAGAGPVPGLDGLGYLRGGPLNPDRPHATWDLVADAFTEGLLVLGGTRSASYDVTLHKIGHALDHIDQMSASTGFAALHSLCRSALADPFYRDRPAELFAEGFALVFTQYPAVLVSLMSGNEARAEVHGLTSADTA